MTKSEKYYGWSDIADFQQAIIFYAEAFSRGYHHHEICKMLDSYFPKIDYITLSKIRTNAFIWLQGLVTNIETKIYLAKSIVRLEQICKNASVKHVLVADQQLTHLLGLANIREESGPEELAALMREFNKKSREASDGTAYKKEHETEQEQEAKESSKTTETTETTETIESVKPQQSQTKPLDEFNLTDDQKKTNETLINARAVRLKVEIEIINDKIKREAEEQQRPQQEKSTDQDLIDFVAGDSE